MAGSSARSSDRRPPSSATLGRSVRIAVLVIVLAVGAAIGTEFALSSSSGLKGTVKEDSFASKAVRGRLRFAIYLPPGYGRGGRYR